MNCCKHDHNEHQESQVDQAHNGHRSRKGGHGSHIWMMLLCCGLPILLIAALPIISRFLPGAANAIGLIAPLICPLMMLPMMLNGMREKRDDRPEGKRQNQEKEIGRTDAGL